MVNLPPPFRGVWPSRPECLLLEPPLRRSVAKLPREFSGTRLSPQAEAALTLLSTYCHAVGAWVVLDLHVVAFAQGVESHPYHVAHPTAWLAVRWASPFLRGFFELQRAGLVTIDHDTSLCAPTAALADRFCR